MNGWTDTSKLRPTGAAHSDKLLRERLRVRTDYRPLSFEDGLDRALLNDLLRPPANDDGEDRWWRLLK